MLSSKMYKYFVKITLKPQIKPETLVYRFNFPLW